MASSSAARDPKPRDLVANRSPGSLAERLLSGDKRALARAITLIENGDAAGWELVGEVFPSTGQARIVGLTGPPGVGKSTLIAALTKELRESDREVGVLSIDPSSPFTRGALLGDRIRLSEHFLDTVVLVLMPGSGDSIQALKAGVMEIPDVIVINKADHPLTDTMEREVRTVLSLGPSGTWKVPVLRTEAAWGEGVTELLARIDEHRRHVEAEGTLEQRRERNLRNEVLGLAAARLRRELEARAEGDPEVAELLARVTRREIDPASAARELLSRSDDG